VEENAGSKFAWFSFMEFEVKHLDKSNAESYATTLKPIFERVLALSEDKLSTNDKLSVLKRYQSYMLHYAPNIQEIRQLEHEILKLKTPPLQSKKRKAGSDTDGSLKVPKTDATPAPSVAVAAPYQQWYGYNPQYYAQYYQQYQQQPVVGVPQQDGANMYQQYATQQQATPDAFSQYLAANRQQ
jgi:hypothetical protein